MDLINAFKRLAEKLKSDFPRLPICILADGLYPSASFFRICTANNWSFCAVLKDKKLSTLWDQVDKSLISAEATGNVENAMIVDDSNTIDWVTRLDYRGTIVNWIESLESFCQDSRRFVFVTNVDLNYSSVREIVTPGRSRWRLEDSFNTQKNRGYRLSHKYSRISFLSTKNDYVLMKIAHLINQLVEYSQHLDRLIDHSKETISALWSLIISALIFVDAETQLTTKHKKTKYSLNFS